MSMEYFEQIKEAVEKLQGTTEEKLTDFKNEVVELKHDLQKTKKVYDDEIVGLKTAQGCGGTIERVQRYRTAEGKAVPFFTKSERLADRHRAAPEEFSLAEYCAANLGLNVQKAVTRGPATVGTAIGAQIVDSVRAASRVMQAGGITIEIESPTNVARIAQDPTVIAHSEGVEDVTESDLALEAISLNPPALIAAIPLSAEIVQDSPNLDQALQTSLGAAFARKLDQLAIDLILGDTNVPSNSVDRSTTDWISTVSAIGDALAADQDVPGALISNASDFAVRNGQLASTGGQWLGRPPFLQNMVDLPTSAIDPGISVLGDFSAVALVTRLSLQLDLIRFGRHTSYSHVMIAHARMAPVVLQPKKLFIQRSIVA